MNYFKNYNFSKLIIICIYLCYFVLLNNPIQAQENIKEISNYDSQMGTAYEPFITDKRVIIDDFEDGNFKNRLGGNNGAWNMDPNEEFSSCTPEIIDMNSPEISKKVLKITYDVDTPTHNQNGFWTKLMDLDARNYDHFEFFVKGDEIKGYTKTIKIEFKKFKDKDSDEKLAASYIVDGINSSWQRFSVPLNKFNSIREWNDLDEFVIIFNDELCDAKEGVLYFDNFLFKNTGHPGPSAYDLRPSSITKTNKVYNAKEWAQWLSKRLYGYPNKLYLRKDFSNDNREFLLEVARDTWRFFDEVVDKKTHLPLDNICFSKEGIFGEGGCVGDYTNVTNIGLYLICLIAAYDFNFIDKEETITRINNTLSTVESLETYNYFLFNYYDTTTSERTSNFISLIDSGWLAAGIYVVKNTFLEDKQLVSRCESLINKWDFSFFYDKIEKLFYHGFFTNIESYSNYHYGAFYTEPRIVSYLAVARGDVPIKHWLSLNRTLPESYTWQQKIPVNRNEKIFHDIIYYGGYYVMNDIEYVPSWGGSIFEALMPTILLKEKEIAPKSLGLNNKRHVQFHIIHALDELGYPVWGMSPCSVPGGGYSEYGVQFLGVRGYKDGVITPHATFLALEYMPVDAIKNLRNILDEFNIYGEYGFYDAANPVTKEVALKYLCLDQAMIFISLDNYLNDGAIRNRFHNDPVIKGGEYLLSDENILE